MCHRVCVCIFVVYCCRCRAFEMHKSGAETKEDPTIKKLKDDDERMSKGRRNVDTDKAQETLETTATTTAHQIGHISFLTGIIGQLLLNMQPAFNKTTAPTEQVASFVYPVSIYSHIRAYMRILLKIPLLQTNKRYPNFWCLPCHCGAKPKDA